MLGSFLVYYFDEFDVHNRSKIYLTAYFRFCLRIDKKKSYCDCTCRGIKKPQAFGVAAPTRLRTNEEVFEPPASGFTN